MTKLLRFKIKRSVRAKVVVTHSEVKIKFPSQSIGTIALVYEKETGEKVVLKQFELTLMADQLKVKTIR